MVKEESRLETNAQKTEGLQTEEGRERICMVEVQEVAGCEGALQRLHMREAGAEKMQQ